MTDHMCSCHYLGKLVQQRRIYSGRPAGATNLILDCPVEQIVSPVVNAKEETAGVSLSSSASPFHSRRSGRETPLQHDSLSIKERNILAIVFTNWGYVGDDYRNGGERYVYIKNIWIS